MLYTTKGTITNVGSVQEFSSGFRKKTLVVKVDDQQYQNEWGLNVLKDDVDLISPNDVGKSIDLTFEVAGREYQGRWFTDLNLKKFSFGGAASPAPAPKAPQKGKVDASNETTNKPIRDEAEDDGESLPF